MLTQTYYAQSAPTHMFDKCAGLNTSTCQYPVIVIAPPAGQAGSLADINDFDIFLLYLSLEMHLAHRSLIPEATVGVSPGARARSLLLAA